MTEDQGWLVIQSLWAIALSICWMKSQLSPALGLAVLAILLGVSLRVLFI